MSSSKRIPQEDVVAYCQGVWDDGTLRATGYCKNRLKERELSLADIDEALFSPECSCTDIKKEGRSWRYRLEGCIEQEKRERIAFVFEIDRPNATLRLITVFSRGEE